MTSDVLGAIILIAAYSAMLAALFGAVMVWKQFRD